MKKITALLLVLVFAFSFAACGAKEDINAKSEGVMTYAQYAAAELETEVTIEGYVLQRSYDRRRLQQAR